MTLRTRLIVHLNGLLVVTVALIAGATAFSTLHNLRDRARQDALDTASLLANAAGMAVRPAPPVAEPPDGWPSPEAKRRAESARGLAERDSWRAAVKRLVQNPPDAGNFQALFVAEEQAQLLAWGSPSDAEDLVSQYWHGIDVIALRSTSTRKPVTSFRDESVVAGVPLRHDGDDAWVFICKFGTERLHQATAASLRRITVLSLGALVLGALVSAVLARRICKPVRELAEAARAIGDGGFDHRVKVESDDELGMLAQSFNKMAGSLETSLARLTEAAAERQARRREMEIAAEIQRSLLPRSCPSLGNVELAAVTVPARDVGGDFYDFIPLPGGRWGIVVADASGKGVPAAILMALSRCLIRAYSFGAPSVIRALELASDFVLDNVRSDMFVTCFYAVIDPANETLTYVNAGHNPPVVVRRQGEIVMLHASGTPLGIRGECHLQEETCHLAAGDVVLMYTDGITDAANTFGEQFGVPRLREILCNVQAAPAEEVCERVLTAVSTFTSGQPQFDDMTLVVLRARPPVAASPEAAPTVASAGEANGPNLSPLGVGD